MNTDQKLPAESAGERPSNPLFGHAITRGDTIGLFAIVLWGFMAGLVRLARPFGATLGSALIYTVGGMPYHRATAETD
ncbi:MAG: hypothetical protein ACLT1O_05735 [Bifidobacterium pseudocatenulatum]